MPCLTLEVKDTILSGLLELLTPGMACQLQRMAPCPSHFKRFSQAGYRMTSEMKEAASIIRVIESTAQKGSAYPAFPLCSYCRGTTNLAGAFFHPERDHIGKCSAVLSTMKTFSSFLDTFDSFTPQEDVSFTVS